jgi:uncharacterized phage infection (PIP) family protein YhgE
MNEEEIKKIAQEEMNKAIMKNLDSSIIFKYISNIEKELEKKDTLINTMQAEFERLENLEDDTDMLKAELKKRDGIVKNIIARLENDIKRITETKAKKSEGLNYLDDYTRNRLQAYKTKTKEIKEYIEKQYFEEIAEYKIKEDK